MGRKIQTITKCDKSENIDYRITKEIKNSASLSSN